MLTRSRNLIHTLNVCIITVLTSLLGCAVAEEQKQNNQSEEPGLGKPLEVLDRRFNEEELSAFLKTRTNPGVLGNLRSYSSLLFAVNSVALRADDEFQWNGDQVLYSPFPDSYRPHWKEKLDMIARQIGAKWSYNHDTGYFMLHPGPMPYPYTIEVADDWKQRDQGNHVVFIPPIAPVGMDIYVLGHYSPTQENRTEVFQNAREKAAMMWASRINRDADTENMETRQVDGEDALYFQSPTPRSPDVIWRQWSVVKNGWSILIVSVMDKENEEVLLPQLEAMVKSVRIGEETTDKKDAPQSKEPS